jgi:transcriptional regulator with XRE-family HTH domain
MTTTAGPGGSTFPARFLLPGAAVFETGAGVGRVSDSGADSGMQQASPALSRLVLGKALRRLREGAGISRETASKAIRASESKISRLELGRTGFKLRDVADLCTLYGVHDNVARTTLLAMARWANSAEWWHQYRDVIASWFEPYVGLEQTASVIRCFEVQYVPGLLQTPDYARAVLELGHGTALESEIERRVQLRIGRQHILNRSQPAHLWAVIDEGALRRPLGGRAAMLAQLRHLIDACDLNNVTIQVLTFRSGGHAGAGPVTMLRMPDPELPDVAYLEQYATAVYPDRSADLDYYRHIMNLLTLRADAAADTPAILHKILTEI